jgi:hypothetical protein
MHVGSRPQCGAEGRDFGWRPTVCDDCVASGANVRLRQAMVALCMPSPPASPLRQRSVPECRLLSLVSEQGFALLRVEVAVYNDCIE